MRHATDFSIGRPVSACLPTGSAGQAPADSPDKWALLTTFTAAVPEYGLSHRAVTVLRALLSFFPKRELPAGKGAAIVFPSNTTLSERLGGMPESTLRRHLRQLVDTGFIARHDSPNGKRFARALGTEIRAAFGFDLSPLARRAGELAQVAARLTRRAEEIALLRAAILAHRNDLLTLCEVQGRDPAAFAALLDFTRLMLRRKVGPEELRALDTRLSATIATLAAPQDPVETAGEIPSETPETSVSNSENERHIQTEKKSVSDSEGRGRDRTRSENDTGPHRAPPLQLQDIPTTFPTFSEFFPEKIVSWQMLRDRTELLIPMLGIDRPVHVEARRGMGEDTASLVVLCILERFAEIDAPGAYLRRLSRLAARGLFDVVPMLAAQRARVAQAAGKIVS
ncbi:plasmid replication protein RepC [Celeribacter indicus]|uniref:Replication initiation protein RepC n=1 Tax=Celeribacter indicus TaxID=1208324 RepID=A0A0B5E9U6_9RHOB|nr:plasmid replication protein RepC [Celeribacter indicus]AJE49107.1 replication initiation protein RepC [Celeribacter indicus]